MDYRRNSEWEADSETYTQNQVEAVANYCDIEIVSETNTHFLAYCPFHNNTDSPAFALDKSNGLWTCFNPSCDNSGNLEGLLRKTKGLNYFEATKVIIKHKDSVVTPITERLAAIREEAPDFVEFPTEPVERMQQDLWADPAHRAVYYLTSRGLSEETIKHFGIGYSSKRDMTIVPMHDPKGMLVGFIGRSVEGKSFKNTLNLPKSKTAWNFHRAKKHGETVIIVESSLDAMRIHQAGYPNVIALLGGSVTANHIKQINETFSNVVIMTDFDEAGRHLGYAIAQRLPNKRILWAAYDDTCVFPHGAKDVGDMTDQEIRRCLTNAVSNFEYVQWGITP